MLFTKCWVIVIIKKILILFYYFTNIVITFVSTIVYYFKTRNWDTLNDNGVSLKFLIGQQVLMPLTLDQDTSVGRATGSRKPQDIFMRLLVESLTTNKSLSVHVYPN